MRRVLVGPHLALAAAALALASAEQQEEIDSVKINTPSPYEGEPRFFSVREPKNQTAPRSPRKSFRKSSKG